MANPPKKTWYNNKNVLFIFFTQIKFKIYMYNKKPIPQNSVWF
jgi:hypothetical protein